MNVNRIELKTRAKGLISVSKPAPISVGLVYLAISLLLALLSARLLSSNITPSDIIQLTKHIEAGNIDYAIMYLQSYMPPASSYIMDFVLSLAEYIIYAGFVIFLLNTIRGLGACYGNLLDGFGFFLKLIWLNILEGIFITLWTMLLIVPGIIASYRYRMALYILIDDPTKSALQCIRESKEMMFGRKAELFVLDLSFVGWALLSGLTFIGWFVQIWTTPYMGLTYALYYETISGNISGQQSGYDNRPPYDTFNPDI